MTKFLGVDIGGTFVKIALVDEEGEILSIVQETSVDFDEYETPILETVVVAIRNFLNASKIREKEIAGIGVSATGAIDSRKGCVAGSAGHIKNWDKSPIKERLEQEFSIRTEVLNDANAAALCEARIGAAKNVNNALIVTVGTGVGGGIIVDSKLLLGRNGYAGEIGHIIIKSKGERCSCGNHDCMEHYCSTKALINRVKESKLLPLGLEIDGKTIFNQISKNKEIATIVDEWIEDLATGLVGLVHIFNPEKIIVGGGVSAQENLFIKPLEEKIKASVMPHFAENLTVEAAKCKNFAGLTGAVFFIKEALMQDNL